MSLAHGEAAASVPIGVTHINPAAEETANVPSRIVQPIDETRLVRLTGNTHPMARPEFDLGLVDPQLPMERIQLVLKRSAEQEAALEKFMAEQYDPKSANFHHWLTPTEFGKLYGPTDQDIANITSWLQNHGFQIYLVTKGRVTIEFSGTAEQVQKTFHTEIHRYLVNGKEHIANNRDPQIPEALAPVFGGIASLHDFFSVHQSILGKYVRRDKKTGRITPVDPEFSGPNPQYGYINEEGNPQEDITPYDFATIYNLLPLWNAGITGKGQTIAISAVTDIEASDVATFRTTFGLGGFTGTINQVHNGADPGVVTADQVENTLDTEWSGAAAPDATVDVVVSASTTTTFGGQLSDSYIVEHPSMFTIMSASYGGCEIVLGTAGNSTLNGIYQQGSAEGISMFESSGDQGSTGCDNSDATTFPAPAKYGLQVNGDASSPYITAVGGTEFTWQNFRTQYWSATNSTTNGSNALGYIPESPWNGTCTSQVLLDRLWNPIYGLTNLEQVCNETVENYDEFVKVTGGSGGVSSCITSSNDLFSTCGGGYAQPSWQKGVTGMPGTQYRYLPDVSLFASSGFPYGVNGSAYLICVASNANPKTCDYADNSEIVYQEVGGTSVSSPALAGIMALVQQKQGSPQGLANPAFYALEAKDNLTNCNSSTVTNGNACNFYDVTYGNNSQVCTTGSIDCVTNTSGDTYGIVSGYTATTGYDQTTGLGSVNATNLVNNWASVAGSPTITLSPTSVTFPSTAVGTTSTTVETVTIKNTGKAAAAISTIEVTGTDATSYTIASTGATACSGTLAAGASCAVEISFKPVSAGTLTATLKVLDNAGTGTQTASITGTGASGHPITLNPSSITFPDTPVGATSEAQPVTVKNTTGASIAITSIALGGTNSNRFIELNTCGASLGAGATCTVFVAFKPGSASAESGDLKVTYSGAGSPQSVALSGTGTAAPTVTLSPTSLTFASTAKNTTSEAKSVTITNSGAETIDITGITVGGTNSTSFSQLNTCGPSLAAGANCVVYVAFTPTAASSLSATLNIADTASGSPQKVTLSGTGH
jgi:subtilase family serine protease